MSASSGIPLLLLSLLVPCCLAEIRLSKVRSDARSIIPLDEFGFTRTGVLELNVSQISLSVSGPKPDDLFRVGFLICTRDSWYHVLQQIQDGDVACALRSNLVKPFYTFDHLGDSTAFYALLHVSDPNLYSLLLCNCVPGLRLSLNVRSSLYNNLGGASGPCRDYLSAGKTVLPRVYFLFFLAYAALLGIWGCVLYRRRAVVFRIHLFMLAVAALKALNLLCESEDKSTIERTGSAHGWDVLFYVFSFLKGISLFTLIVLIGAGWSFLKPHLQHREKTVLMIVIPLQVVSNVARVAIDETGPYGRDLDAWKRMFLVVDVVCCCAVLFPIVWSIRNLREAAKSDGKAAVNLMKLTLFRQYYVLVICFIYFTRVVVYALEIITSYRYQWTSVVAAELANLAFYVFTGYNFRPKVHNPYFAVDDDEEEAAAEELKLEEEFEL